MRFSGSWHHLQTSYIELNPKSTKSAKIDPYIFDTVETGRSGSLNATWYFVLKKHGSIALQALSEVKIAQHQILCSAKTGHRYLWSPMRIPETRMPPASTLVKVKHSLQTVLHRILNVSLTFRGLASAVNVTKETTCNTLAGTCLLHQFILKYFWELGRV